MDNKIFHTCSTIFHYLSQQIPFVLVIFSSSSTKWKMCDNDEFLTEFFFDLVGLKLRKMIIASIAKT